MFLHFITLMWSVAFLCLAPYPSCATLSQVGLFEVPMIYLGSLGYFTAWGPVLANSYPSKRLLLMGGSGMYSLLSMVTYPKRAHSTSWMLLTDY
jgi:hypothetical protein